MFRLTRLAVALVLVLLAAVALWAQVTNPRGTVQPGTPPTLASLSVSTGQAGTAVTLTGTGFGATQGVSFVRFNGLAAPVTSWADTSILVAVPENSTTGPVVVIVGGAPSNALTFTVPAPTLASLSISSGAVSDPVTLTGTNFGTTPGLSRVTFNGTLATVLSWSTTSLATTVPAGATTGAVIVTVSGQSTAGVTFTVGGAATSPIAASRSIDWTAAGIAGGIPARATQCGSTIAAYNGSAATINTAIANCPAGQHVQLGAGTFTLSSGIDWGATDNVTLRGLGANSTLIVFTAGGAGLYNSLVAMEGSFNDSQSEGNLCNWTAGYARGATTITLANCGTATPAHGAIGNLKVGGLLFLDQLDEINDTGTIWNCAATIGQTNPCANTVQGGSSRFDGPCNGGVSLGTNGPGCLRTQQQGVLVASCDGNSTPGHACASGTNLTISPGLYMPNWSSGQQPQAWYPTTTRTGDGIEALSIDNCQTHGANQTCTTGISSGQTVHIANCNQCWVKGVRGLFANRSNVQALMSAHIVIRDNYFFENMSHSSVSYGAELMGSFDSLIENNIFQQNSDSEPSCSGACAGNVMAYNFAIADTYAAPGWMQASNYLHNGGDSYNLWEGNIGPGFVSDQVHGTHHFSTVYRNYLIGNQDAGCGSSGLNTCTQQTIPVQLYAGSRYFNLIGNVLGQAGYHTSYYGSATTTAALPDAIHYIYVVGYTNNSGGVLTSLTGFCSSPACSTTNYFDPQTGAYLMRWGNYDTVTAATQWVAAEVPSSVSPYGNPVPASQSLPASLYLAAKPSWFGSLTYPPIGPDVTGGPGPGGHAYQNPAQSCFLNTMGGPANGTGDARPFNAVTCYGS